MWDVTGSNGTNKISGTIASAVEVIEAAVRPILQSDQRGQKAVPKAS